MKKMMCALVLLAFSSQAFAALFDSMVYNYTGKPLEIKFNLKNKNDVNASLTGDSLSEKYPVKLLDSYRAIEVWGENGKAKLFRDQDELDYFKSSRPQTEVSEDMIYSGDASLWPSGLNPREVHIYPNEVNGVTVGGYRIELR